MITVKSAVELKLMREAGRIAKLALTECGKAVKPGVTTKQLDDIARKVIRENGATPSFLGYNGFPGAICCSINEVVIHGIPDSRKVEEGDIVSIDVGAIYKGYHGDNADTFAAGTISEEAQRLIDVTRQSFYEGIKQAVIGNRVSDISKAVQDYAEAHGYGVVRDFVGHGIGTQMHEAPEVPNYYSGGNRGVRLVKGMTLAIEPMVNLKLCGVKIMPDGWTVKTVDGAISAHYENTIVITENGPVILTSIAED